MPRSHLVTLIIRLLLGFVILGVLAFVMFSKLRKPKTDQPQQSPEITLHATPVTIITPVPTPTPSSLPSIGDEDGKGDYDDTTTEPEDEYVTETIIESYPNETTTSGYRHEVSDNGVSSEAWQHSTPSNNASGTRSSSSAAASSSSSSSNGSSYASASATSTNGYASASAYSYSW